MWKALWWLLVVLLPPAAVPLTSAAAPSHWRPPQHLTWYWQLTGSLDNSRPAAAYDIDGFDNPASEVAALHAAGKHVICYIDVGTWENWRSDAGQFPGSVKGSDNGWPGERWLDIRQLSVLEPIMTARFRMCKQKGFDAVEPDNIDGYENSTGFPISAHDQLMYDEWIAQEVHALGLAVFQKNDPEQANTLAPYFDGELDEQCNQYSECSSFQPYLNGGKPVLNAEYQGYPGFCAADNAAGIMGALFSINLDGSTYRPCFSPTSGSPGPGGGSGSAPRLDRTNPTLGIAADRLRVRGDVAGVRMSCSRNQSYCDGMVRLATVRKFAGPRRGSHAHERRALVLGAARFHILGGRTVVLRIKLSFSALRRFGRAKTVRVLISATARDAARRRGSLRGRMTLVLG